jgi:hypothetical protein
VTCSTSSAPTTAPGRHPRPPARVGPVAGPPAVWCRPGCERRRHREPAGPPPTVMPTVMRCDGGGRAAQVSGPGSGRRRRRRGPSLTERPDPVGPIRFGLADLWGISHQNTPLRWSTPGWPPRGHNPTFLALEPPATRPTTRRSARRSGWRGGHASPPGHRFDQAPQDHAEPPRPGLRGVGTVLPACSAAPLSANAWIWRVVSSSPYPAHHLKRRMPPALPRVGPGPLWVGVDLVERPFDTCLSNMGSSACSARNDHGARG